MKNKMKDTHALAMTEKQKKGFRIYASIILCLAFAVCCSLTVFAASDDPLAVVRFHVRSYPCYRNDSARLWYCPGRSES